MDASQKPTPANVLGKLRRAIASRRWCTAWYQGQSINNASLGPSNRSHEHFNDVLDELFHVLAQFYGEGGAEASGKRPEDIKDSLDSVPAKDNPFDVLELEDLNIADQYDEHTVVEEIIAPQKSPISKTKTKKVKKPQTPAEYQVEDSPDDMRFAMFNMFKDLYQIRQHIHKLLQRYDTSDVSLVLVAAVINSAIGIVRSIETKFFDSLPPQPQLSSWEDIMSIIATPAQFDAVSKGLSEDSELVFLYSIYCLPFQQLRQFRESRKEGTFPSYPTGRVPFASPQPSDRDLRLREMTILNEYFQEVALLGGKETLASEDELTRGIMGIFEGQGRGNPKSKANTVPLWVVFGLQIFLDTQQILRMCLCSHNCLILLTTRTGSNVTRAFREVTATGNIYRSNIEDHVVYSQDIQQKEHTKQELKKLRKNLNTMVHTWIDRDRLMELRKLRKTSRAGRPFFFLSHNPVVCGVMQCAILVKSQIEGITRTNIMVYAASAAYLYHAVRNEGYLKIPWQDMEYLFDNHGLEEIFLGERPQSANSYRNHFLVACGYSTKNFAPDHLRAKGLQKSGRPPRVLKVSEIVKTFAKLLCQTDPTKTDISVDLIETFLHRTVHAQGTQKKKHDALRARWDKHHMLNPIQLLALLEECLTEEESKLHFDYYAFYKSCFLLLSSIETELRDDFAVWVSEYKSVKNLNANLNLLPTFIFTSFIKQSKGKYGPPANNILVRVTRVFERFIVQYASEPSEKTIGVVDESNLRTDTEHGAQSDVCIHWGSCERLTPDS